MFKMIKICLSHPKYIAMYYKEKTRNVVMLILTFFLAFSMVAYIGEKNRDFFTSYDNDEIVQAVIRGENKNITFDSQLNKFVGDYATYTSTYYNIYFLPKGEITIPEKERKTSIVFLEEEYKIYYAAVLVHKGDYTNENLENIDISLVNLGDIDNIHTLNKLLTVILNDSNDVFANLSMFNYVATMITYYFGIVGLLFIFTSLSNPTIGKGVRFKLCCLDTLIFVFAYSLQIMFNIYWIIYIASALPIFYSNVTFMHIVRKVD